jgi:hypothetical protein
MYGLLNALQDPPNDGKCSNPPCLIHRIDHPGPYLPELNRLPP